VNDVEGFDAFYAARAAPLVRALYLRTGDLSRSQDCVQEAFTRAWLRWDALEAGPGPAAWVRTVAWNLAVSQWRSKTREIARSRRLFALEGRSETSPPPPIAEVVALREALRGLPDAHQTAVVLHYFVDMSVQEIANMTGRPTGTVKSDLSRARLALREALAEDEVESPMRRTSRGHAGDGAK
jgi:RNA polymerase sigma-70 factor, ECF subfamily